jgi:hypothetical protein
LKEDLESDLIAKNFENKIHIIPFHPLMKNKNGSKDFLKCSPFPSILFFQLKIKNK